MRLSHILLGRFRVNFSGRTCDHRGTHRILSRPLPVLITPVLQQLHPRFPRLSLNASFKNQHVLRCLFEPPSFDNPRVAARSLRCLKSHLSIFPTSERRYFPSPISFFFLFGFDRTRKQLMLPLSKASEEDEEEIQGSYCKPSLTLVRFAYVAVAAVFNCIVARYSAACVTRGGVESL